MDHREQDSQNTSSQKFHPLQFAIIASILVLLTTGIISYISSPKTMTSIPFYHPQISLSALKKAPWVTLTIETNDTLLKLFNRNKLNLNDYKTIVQLPDVKAHLTHLIAKQSIYVLLDKKNNIQQLVYVIDHAHYLEVAQTASGLAAKIITIELIEKEVVITGTINQSFSLAASRAGLPTNITMALTAIFGWDINFSRGTQPGDQFVVIYNAYFDRDKPVKAGDIIAAEFINHAKKYYAIRYKAANNNVDYYTPAGKNLRRAFLRAPIQYKRVSSPFNAKRVHPILHITRPHEGVDLAAPVGTPIHASADGEITFRGRRGGYGRCIVMQNGPKYSTLFAHMSRFASPYHVGSYVKEGTIIGYVGQSGLATGPHLHYEFRIYGVHYDPMKVKLPGANSVPKNELSNYAIYAQKLVDQLNAEKIS